MRRVNVRVPVYAPKLLRVPRSWERFRVLRREVVDRGSGKEVVVLHVPYRQPRLSLSAYAWLALAWLVGVALRLAAPFWDHERERSAR